MSIREAVASLATRLRMGLAMSFNVAVKNKVAVTLDERYVIAFETMAKAANTLAAESVKQTALLSGIDRRLRRAFPPASAKNLRFRLIKETDMSRIVFELDVDPPDPDVVKRVLTLTATPATGGDPIVTTVNGTKDTVLFSKDDAGNELAGPQDATMVASLVDIDDSNNPADPDEITFQLLDQFKPASASGLGVRFIREIPDAAPPA